MVPINVDRDLRIRSMSSSVEEGIAAQLERQQWRCADRNCRLGGTIQPGDALAPASWRGRGNRVLLVHLRCSYIGNAPLQK